MVVVVAAQQPADAVERVAGAAAVPELLLLDAAADVVDGSETEPHDVERIQHPHRVGQRGAQRAGGAPVRSKAAVVIPDRQDGSCLSTHLLIDPAQQRRYAAPVDAGEPVRVAHSRLAMLADRGHRGAPPDPELPPRPTRPTRRPHRPGGRSRPAHGRSTRPAPRCTARSRSTSWSDTAGADTAHPLDPHHCHRTPGREQVPHPHQPPIMQLGDRGAGRATDQILPWSRSPAPTRRRARTRRAPRIPPCPTSPPRHHALVPPGASHVRVLDTTDHEAQVEDRVLQRRTTLRDEEPGKAGRGTAGRGPRCARLRRRSWR